MDETISSQGTFASPVKQAASGSQSQQAGATTSRMNDFKILATLGRGSYSIVYKVLRLTDNRIYALKKVLMTRLSEKEKSNALNEIRILASIHSDHVVEYRDSFFDVASESLCIVMEFAGDGDLSTKLQALKQQQKQQFVESKDESIASNNACYLAESLVWDYLVQTLKGLQHLHEMQILHRDLKPANLFISTNNLLKIGDLNVSKVARNTVDQLAKTAQTGTPYYTAPEIWKGDAYTNQSDVWSLGCIVYEMCALHPPFSGTSIEGLYLNITAAKYDRIPEFYSDALASVVSLCLLKDPLERPSCVDLLQQQMLLAHVAEYEEKYKHHLNNRRQHSLVYHGQQQQQFVDQTPQRRRKTTGSKKSKHLIDTIPLPSSWKKLSALLPRANYDDSAVISAQALPSISEFDTKYGQMNIIPEKLSLSFISAEQDSEEAAESSKSVVIMSTEVDDMSKLVESQIVSSFKKQSPRMIQEHKQSQQSQEDIFAKLISFQLKEQESRETASTATEIRTSEFEMMHYNVNNKHLRSPLRNYRQANHMKNTHYHHQNQQQQDTQLESPMRSNLKKVEMDQSNRTAKNTYAAGTQFDEVKSPLNNGVSNSYGLSSSPADKQYFQRQKKQIYQTRSPLKMPLDLFTDFNLSPPLSTTSSHGFTALNTSSQHNTKQSQQQQQHKLSSKPSIKIDQFDAYMNKLKSSSLAGNSRPNSSESISQLSKQLQPQPKVVLFTQESEICNNSTDGYDNKQQQQRLRSKQSHHAHNHPSNGNDHTSNTSVSPIRGIRFSPRHAFVYASMERPMSTSKKMQGEGLLSSSNSMSPQSNNSRNGSHSIKRISSILSIISMKYQQQKPTSNQQSQTSSLSPPRRGQLNQFTHLMKRYLPKASDITRDTSKNSTVAVVSSQQSSMQSSITVKKSSATIGNNSRRNTRFVATLNQQKFIASTMDVIQNIEERNNSSNSSRTNKQFPSAMTASFSNNNNNKQKNRQAVKSPRDNAIELLLSENNSSSGNVNINNNESAVRSVKWDNNQTAVKRNKLITVMGNVSKRLQNAQQLLNDYSYRRAPNNEQTSVSPPSLMRKTPTPARTSLVTPPNSAQPKYAQELSFQSIAASHPVQKVAVSYMKVQQPQQQQQYSHMRQNDSVRIGVPFERTQMKYNNYR